MILDKATVRQKFRTLRDQHSREEKCQADIALGVRLKDFLEQFKPQSAMAYEPLKNEADPFSPELDFEFSYPSVIGDGLMEARTASDELVEPSQLDMVLVPGIAFDRQGRRLGFGKGYYDRFLTNTNACRVGIAYSFQVSSDELPSEEWDQRVEWIVTDRYVLHVERKDQGQWKR